MKHQRPKILYLVHRVPYPPNRGDRIRSFHILDYLSKRADVHLATLADEPVSDATREALQARCHNLAIERLGRARWIRATLNLAQGRAATEGLFRSSRLFRTVNSWASQTHFDAVVVYCSSMLQYLAAPSLRSIPAIIDLVDVDSQKWFDYAAVARGVKARLFRLEGSRTRRLEAEACRRASSVLLVSEAEAELFRKVVPNDHTYGMPNGVDLNYFRPADSSGLPGRCVFVGALDYRANIDGICWFCRNVWPQVIAQIPSATLAIVGRNPTAEVQNLSSVPGVEVFGSVPDVRPYLAEASLVVVPLRIARGIQNKVLEAMAAGRAVIASREALEGIAVQFGEHVVDANTSRQWSNETVRLLNDREERSRLGRAGRKFVMKQHAWESCLARLDHELLQLNAREFKSPKPLPRYFETAESSDPHSLAPVLR